DLAAGNKYLEARRGNIFYDFAQAYTIQGKTREAIEYLAKFGDLLPYPGALEQNPRFAPLRTDPAFQAILTKMRRFEQLWDSAALNTPYRENLSDEEKIAGLSKFWSEIKYNFGYPEKLIELKWDDLYLQTIPKVLATKSMLAYYQELLR